MRERAAARLLREEESVETITAGIDNTATIGHVTIDEDEDLAIERATEKFDVEPSVTYFTDGSRDDKARTGAAFIRRVKRPQGQEKIIRGMRRLGIHRMTAYDAELIALQMALKDALERRQRGGLRGNRVWIFSDAQAALRRVRKLDDGPGQPIVRAIHTFERSLSKLGIEVEYCWVPGHKGVPGNELADKAAKRAATRGTRKHDTHYTSLSHLHGAISMRVTETRKQFISERVNKAFVYGGQRKMNPVLQKCSKKEASAFWQMSCGHALTGDYLKNKIRKTDDDTCWHCGSGQQMTRAHLFERCTAFKEERGRLWEAIGKTKEKVLAKGKRRPGRIQVGRLFSQEKYTEAVLGFLRETKIGRRGRPPDNDGQTSNDELGSP